MSKNHIEAGNFNMAYCPEHDWWYTIARWSKGDQPFFQCMKCRKEYTREWYKWWNSLFEDGNKG